MPRNPGLISRDSKVCQVEETGNFTKNVLEKLDLLGCQSELHVRSRILLKMQWIQDQRMYTPNGSQEILFRRRTHSIR
jgi:hypothetical protein